MKEDEHVHTICMHLMWDLMFSHQTLSVCHVHTAFIFFSSF